MQMSLWISNEKMPEVKPAKLEKILFVNQEYVLTDTICIWELTATVADVNVATQCHINTAF